MTIYIALLRGINVGGNKKLKMADLKMTFESLGFGQVQTYIQSGNILFVSPDEPATIRERIEHEIKSVYGMSVSVILRTAEQLEDIVGRCPYSPDSLSEGESIYFTLTTDILPKEDADRLPRGEHEIDEFVVDGTTIYLLYRQRILDSKLSNQLQKLKTPATTRNWNTMNKLVSLANAMKAK